MQEKKDDEERENNDGHVVFSCSAAVHYSSNVDSSPKFFVRSVGSGCALFLKGVCAQIQRCVRRRHLRCSSCCPCFLINQPVGVLSPSDETPGLGGNPEN